MRFSKKIMTCMLIFLVVFTAVVLYISYEGKSEPSTLVASVFTFCSVEGGCLALIKSVETREETKKKPKKKK